ncbi:MAG: hypothetical protein Kow0049_30890 [Stanieria sp.]
MNTSKIILQTSGLFALAASSLLLVEMPAHAINLSLDSSAFTVQLGIGSNAVPVTSTINTGNFSNGSGFENHFSQDFLLLGALADDSTIPTDSLDFGNSRAVSTQFTLSSQDVSEDLNINFKWAFNGNATGAAGDQDNFTLSIVGPTNQTFFTKTLPGGYGKDTSTATISANTLTAGNYRLRINVNENDDFDLHSSAAGFDDIQLASVPFEFSPSQGLLLVGGFWGLSNFIKRRKQLADSSKDLFN